MAYYCKVNFNVLGILGRFQNFLCIHRNFSGTGSLHLPISSAELNHVDETLKVGFSDGETHEYPWLFLQDNCTCSKCFHHSSQSRTRRMTELNSDNVISKVEYSGEGVKCIWKDGHEGLFNKKWLKDRKFTEDNFRFRKLGFRDNPQLVGSNYVMHREHFNDVMTTSRSLLTTLKILCETGVCLIEGAPEKVGQLRKLADKIGFIRLTHYGYEFTVKSEKNAVNLAYTSTKLGVHTDLPYYVYPPGVQMLHCITQFGGVDGGQSHLVDGFLVAEQMRVKHPEEFKTLYQVPVEFRDIGEDFTKFHKIHHSPTFVLNPDTNQLTRIVYSNQQLSSYQPVPLRKVKMLYEALRIFTNLCYDSANLMKFKLKEGEILIFDNWRFLHGREGFDPAAGDRHLEGCYVDWDEVFSRIRVLESVNETETEFK